MPLFPDFIQAPDLYCITDSRLSTLSHREQMEQMIAGGARLIQLREKTLSDDALRPIASECLDLCRSHGVFMVLNDRVTLAAELAVDGIHLGQGDMSPTEARAILGDKIHIGLSTHSIEQFSQALTEPVDAIAFGPVFGTTTKLGADPATGLQLTSRCAELITADSRPLILIGGIARTNLAELRRAAPKAIVAAIGDILRGDITENVRGFRSLVKADR